MRDVTSGAFAPRYSPHYRVIAVHSPNRIVVRDEKGSETVRRASHLKHCDPRTKFTSMVPENKEYEEFGRSTKLLLHPKDVSELQFPVETITGRERAAPESLVDNLVVESVVDLSCRSSESSESRDISPDLDVDNNNNGEQ